MPACREEIERVYSRLDVTFDHTMGESCYQPLLAGVVDDLTALIMEDWNPEWISSRLTLLRGDLGVLSEWARQTQPVENYRWDLRPEMDFLDVDQM